MKLRITAVAVCLLITCGFVYLRREPIQEEKRVSLDAALGAVNGWKKGPRLGLDFQIVQELKLDDYASNMFSNGTSRLFLYIGYYATAKKVGAAHDPLVCFPGQGWSLDEKKTGELQLSGSENRTIRYSSMIADRNGERQLLIYWFQSFDQTSNDTFHQKLQTFWNRVVGNASDNAFVRISIPLDNLTETEARRQVFQFVRSFYPVFLNYIVTGPRPDGPQHSEA